LQTTKRRLQDGEATVQILLVHTKIEMTARYLRVKVEKPRDLAEGTEI
jgi:hypothetical protein